MEENIPPDKLYYISATPWIHAHLRKILHTFELYPHIYFDMYLVVIKIDPSIPIGHIGEGIVYGTYKECFDHCVQYNMNRNIRGDEYFGVLECVKQVNAIIDSLMRAFNYWMKEVCILGISPK